MHLCLDNARVRSNFLSLLKIHVRDWSKLISWFRNACHQRLQACFLKSHKHFDIENGKDHQLFRSTRKRNSEVINNIIPKSTKRQTTRNVSVFAWQCYRVEWKSIVNIINMDSHTDWLETRFGKRPSKTFHIAVDCQNWNSQVTILAKSKPKVLKIIACFNKLLIPSS